jgi:hypothetical protein
MSFCVRTPKWGVPKFPKLGLLWLWRPITFWIDLQLRWVLKKNFSLCQDLSNDMCHATYTWVNQKDFKLLMVGSQIDNLTPDPSFGHNLWFKYPNGSCKPILDIYVPRDFPWYKELFNPMSFDPAIALWKFESPLKVHWESNSQSEKVHSFTFSYIFVSMKCDSRVSLLARTFVNPCLGREPKVKVATTFLWTLLFTCDAPPSSLLDPERVQLC